MAGGFLLSFWWHGLFLLFQSLIVVFWGLVGIDLYLLYAKKGVNAIRILPEKFSNSDVNTISLSFENKYPFRLNLEIIDEIPIQFQKRNFYKKISVKPHKLQGFKYGLRPVERGVYTFGKLNVYASSPIRLIRRRYSFQEKQQVKVYPSFIQMKRYDFLAIDQRLNQIGMKKIRRIGHTMEFEQIKNYVRGDDIRTINWKASAKHGSLMVNQYQDERAQPVISIINTGREMKMPFEGLKLLDYAINSCLAFSNIALKKNDKVGLLTYAQKPENYLVSSNRKTHLHQLMETLYHIDTDFSASDVGLLYAYIKRRITQRSLIMLYTNLEHFSSLKRQLPYYKAIAKQHVLVIVFFENTEVKTLLENKAEHVSTIYDQTIAQEFVNQKQRMLKELRKNKIQAVLSTPKNLSVATINKYLELKARGIL